MIDRRTLLGTVTGIAAVGGLSACGRRDGGTHKGADAVPVSWLKCRIAEPSAIDPLYVVDRAGLQVLSALFTPLMELASDGRLSAAAAKSYEMSEDARTFTFRLREGATFSDGEDVTATSFKFAWERLVRALPSEAVESGRGEPEFCRWGHLLRLVDGYSALRAGRASELVGLRCPDDLTYVVSLTEPCPFFAQIAAHPALAPVPANADLDTESYGARPIGNGPFKLKRDWKPGAEIQLAANKDYIMGPPMVDGVLLIPMADTVGAFKQFSAGNIDICDVPVERLSEAGEATGASEDGATMTADRRLAHGVDGGLLYLTCNCLSGAFSRIDIRRAASMAIDREALCRKTLKHSAEMAVSPISPRIAEQRPWEACAYDPEGALQLVETASLSTTDPTSADMGSAGETPDAPEADSEPMDLSVNLIYRKGGTRARVAAQVVRDLEAVGLSAKGEGLDADEFVRRFKSADFDCALRTFEPAVPTLDVVADSLFARAECASGVVAAHDASVEQALSPAWEMGDSAEREVMIWEALAKAGEGLPIIPLAHPAYTKIASERVATSVVDASGTIDLYSSELL